MEYLKIWTSFLNVIEPLSDDEAGRLFRMMINYTATGEEPGRFAGNERFLWPTAKQSIDLMAKKSEILRQNGLKGGRPQSKDNQYEPNESKENQTKAYKVNIKKSKDKDKVINKERRFIPPTLEEVSAYCKERNNNVDPQRFIDFYASKGWKVGDQGMKDWKACVRTWEGRDKKPAKTVVAQQYGQRDYSGEQDDAMKRMLELA